MTSPFIIYGLVDPVTSEIRYIGKSTSGLKRPLSHLFPSNLSKDKTYKTNWIKALLSKNIAPAIVVLEEFQDRSTLGLAEQFWIAQGRGLNYQLTNLTKGGEGALGRKLSIETREKISKSHIVMAHSQTTKDKLSALKKGIAPKHVVTDEIRSKISNFHKGRKFSPEHKAKLTVARKKRGPISEETREKMRQARRNRYCV